MKAAILRTPCDTDWPAILDLANRSVKSVPRAGAQDAWLKNRQLFNTTSGIQRHWVAEQDTVVAGYCSVESSTGGSPDSYRIFVITEPADRATLGQQLLDRTLAELAKLGAKTASFTEYANDADFIEFLQQHGFNETDRLDLDKGTAVVLSKSLGSK